MKEKQPPFYSEETNESLTCEYRAKRAEIQFNIERLTIGKWYFQTYFGMLICDMRLNFCDEFFLTISRTTFQRVFDREFNSEQLANCTWISLALIVVFSAIIRMTTNRKNTVYMYSTACRCLEIRVIDDW
jgi:hypothetical protein